MKAINSELKPGLGGEREENGAWRAERWLRPPFRKYGRGWGHGPGLHDLARSSPKRAEFSPLMIGCWWPENFASLTRRDYQTALWKS